MRIPSLGEADLLVPLYEGVFEQPMWHTFLDRLRRLTNSSFCGFDFRLAESEDAVQLGSGKEEISSQLRSGCVRKFGRDPFRDSRMREGRAYSLEELVEAEGASVEELRRDILQPIGVEFTRSLRLRDASGLESWLLLAGEEKFDTAAGNLLVALTPHLRVALRTLAELERQRRRVRVGEEAFARMNFGWIAVDRRCAIVDCDPQAVLMLQRSGLLRRGPYDRLTPSSPQVDRQLTQIIRQFAGGGLSRPQAINLSRDPWMDILVSPLNSGDILSGAEAVAAIFFRGDRSSSADRQAQLAELFGLTPAEARLAWSLAQGQSIAEAAVQHGLTLETARYYSKKIYSKMGASGQVELMRNIQTGVLALA